MDQWWDAHCHLSFLRDEQLATLFRHVDSHNPDLAGHFIQGGYDPQDWKRQIEISKSYPSQLRLCFGLHPWALLQLDSASRQEAWDQLLELSPQAHLIGETGLDHFITQDPGVRATQVDFFRRHLDLARTLNRPLVLHIVQAHQLAIELLNEQPLPSRPGIIHGFSASTEMAQEYISLGFLISIGPALLKKGFKQLKRTALNIKMEHLVIESDSPSDRLEPELDLGLVNRVAQEIAKIKGLPITEVQQRNQQNLEVLCGL
ncbi:MAG: TatD family hydrolase [Bdellovibrionales bacterium]|nr:TatD family hydrolase [Bdellovibrionales bacterium]